MPPANLDSYLAQYADLRTVVSVDIERICSW